MLLTASTGPRTNRSTGYRRPLDGDGPFERATDGLPEWFASIRSIADAVIALDDGSTDGTRELLAADPLVERILARPRRPDYVEWDDAGNRSALLRAADELRPRWILWLDADERTVRILPAEDWHGSAYVQYRLRDALGVRLEYTPTRRYTLETFYEDRFSRSRTIGFQDVGLVRQKILGLFLFTEWGF